MNIKIPGLHHVTAIASDPQRNLDFYVGLLGLRFVKRTVNFDDPGTYHFYFGDNRGTPGTILTFFPWPGAPLCDDEPLAPDEAVHLPALRGALPPRRGAPPCLLRVPGA